MKRMFLFVLLIISPIFAKTLYVDAEKGKDANPGTSPKPFKTIQAAADRVQPGDTVLVSPGRYPEVVSLKTAGTKEKPIVFKSVEKRKAIIDGSEPLRGFEPCGSAEEAGGNPNFKNIVVANLPKGVTPEGANLFEGDNRLYMSQNPEPRDWFYFDDREVFLPIDPKGYSPTSLTHKKFLVEKFNTRKPEDWNGATVLVWTGNNAIIACELKTFDPETGKITFSQSTKYINPGKDGFAMANHPRLISAAGQFAVGPEVNGVRKLYLWPHDPKKINESVRCSVRKVGIKLNGKSHNTIDGFCVEKICGEKGDRRGGMGILNAAGWEATGVKILNNEIRDCRAGSGYWALTACSISDMLIEGNYVHHNQHNRGIGATGMIKNRIKNVTIQNNTVEQCGGTGINFYHVDDSKILNNRVLNNRGNHANGITVYLFCRNITVANNTVLDGNMAITIQKSSEITIYNNLLTGKRNPKTGKNLQSRILVLYGGKTSKNITVLNNTVLYSSNGSGISIPKDAEGYVVKNNITDGIGAPKDFNDDQILLENNIYLSLCWNMREPKGEKSGLLKDWTSLFVNAKKGDFRLDRKSPAVDAGADTTDIVKTDIIGVTRPQLKAVDIGAYEYKPEQK